MCTSTQEPAESPGAPADGGTVVVVEPRVVDVGGKVVEGCAVVSGAVTGVVVALTLVCVVLTPSPDEQEESTAARASAITALARAPRGARCAQEESGQAPSAGLSFTLQLLR